MCYVKINICKNVVYTLLHNIYLEFNTQLYTKLEIAKVIKRTHKTAYVKIVHKNKKSEHKFDDI